MKKFAVISAFIFTGSFAHAVMTINGFSGVSNQTITATPTTPGSTTPVGTATAVIYGGTAGIDNLASGTCGGGTTCNTCVATSCINDAVSSGFDQAPLCACNTKAIYPSLPITVSVTKTPVSINTSVLRAYVGSPGGTVVADISRTTLADSVTFWWQDLCGKMANSDPNCTASDNLQITIWDDKNGDNIFQSGEDQVAVTVKLFNPGTDSNVYGETTADGVKGFEPFPGDERIYFKSLQTTNNFPLTSYGGTVKAIRAYVSTVSMDNAAPGKTSIEPQDMPVPANASEIERPYIESVSNGQRYFVRLAMVDMAENVVQFYPSQTSLGTECTSAPADSCPFAIYPEKVLGLLTNDLNCFIATAAYGSSLEPKLKIFRDFRMELLSHSWGKKLVLAYYDYGPYAARMIAESEVLRSVTRSFLWPVLGYSWLSMRIGFYPATAIALTLLFSLSALTFITIRRLGTRA